MSVDFCSNNTHVRDHADRVHVKRRGLYQHAWTVTTQEQRILPRLKYVTALPCEIFTDRISERGNAVAFVRLSVRLFAFTLSSEPTDR